jgi:glycosidase
LQADPGSILHLYRELLALRHSHAALNIGAFELINSDANVLAYTRPLGDQRVVVVLNLGDEMCIVPELLRAPRLCSTDEAATDADLSDKVGPHAAVIARLA